MGFVELFLIGVGLSMDAFAVSICKGLGMKRLNMGQALVIGLFFGGFQALMPLIGWALGTQLADFITPIDHWIAFILLALTAASNAGRYVSFISAGRCSLTPSVGTMRGKWASQRIRGST